MTVFDYCSPAELFVGKRRGPQRRLGYRRFATAAEAIRFAIEDFPAMRTLGACMQVGDSRYDCDEILHLYESGNYPLTRRLLQAETARIAACTKFYISRGPWRTSTISLPL